MTRLTIIIIIGGLISAFRVKRIIALPRTKLVPSFLRFNRGDTVIQLKF